ncbi:restriction endonuclease subunit S [Serratia proteamaculans]|uniref:Restriction endonuclease subunit S n=1 Tax=Serratia proteamaculans TaxID=28151 RepID=A0A7U0N9A8_SERPR|nr:restriction endonuclease subunit S [Serratia proteamaculans]MBO1503073.1 restriction endonuclease subunit S [Serratia proteamaculans]MDW5511497.1 restriction endonuclease subunit S [Serratia proteamaculans]QQX54848.1 restriction endonuclease subunit S [Serratia proteamaculans]
MNVEKKVPEVRFKGFSGEWELKTIAELIDDELIYPPKDGNHGNIHPKSTDYVKYGIPFVMANNIKGGKIKFHDCYHISLSQAQTLQKGFAKTGDVLLTHKGTVGEVAVVPQTEFPYLMLTPQVTYYRTCGTIGLDTHFLATSFITDSFQTPLKQESGGGTRAYIGITAQQKLRISTPPKFEEQTQIGNYFQKIDALINQHQQKHDKLNSIKKAMLEKMFPKQGKTIPEIRFKGFSGEWQERLFSDIATRVSTHHQSTCLPCVEYEDIVAGKGRFNKDIHQKKTFKAGLKFEAGDVLFGKLRPYLKNWFLADFEGLAVGDFWVLRAVNVASTFLFSLIQTNEFELISNLSAGSKMPRSDWGLVSTSCFFVPENIAESNEIGNYFQKLDSLINQHQQQITKLNNIKQACLSKMFV